MDKLNCIIVEDEPLAAEILEDYIRQIPFLQLKAICTDALYAMEALQQHKVDVMFLDIHLPKLKGIDLIKTLKNPPQIILTTAYRDYAIDGYELNVADYLLKPISFQRFAMAANKLKGVERHSANSIQPAERNSILINVNKKRVKLYFDEILYIESQKEYIKIVTPTDSYLTKLQISEIEAYKDTGLLRVHRSFLASTAKINAFSATQLDIQGCTIPIGRSYKDAVMAILHHTNTTP